MIQLTKFNGEVFTINALLIERIESVPDTLITLTNGKKINVKEDANEVSAKSTDYFKSINVFYEINKE
ncbi:flagellar FlbD family protein [Niallia taxi]|uniref:flagellar FlbD family protein n=1 Tax=Niallia taxi TaxID=2499688 RepID=UPI0015F74A7B|nr:flagellar FlbD family protein [Niallia taxi]